jgi:hypothetical protein
MKSQLAQNKKDSFNTNISTQLFQQVNLGFFAKIKANIAATCRVIKKVHWYLTHLVALTEAASSL